MEPGPPKWEAGYKHSELWHGHTFFYLDAFFVFLLLPFLFFFFFFFFRRGR
jgi:hypothetical protein